jgi:alkanesulfonate monooxygenase SsuD/methylene tetrahydromethanopterin reductase-like flavin-dependent oxidoreductase (luciferase family)
VFFQGVNSTTIWSSPDSGSQISPLSFRQVAQTAERGLFDAFFLGEGLRLREVGGRIHDLDIAGRPGSPVPPRIAPDLPAPDLPAVRRE